MMGDGINVVDMFSGFDLCSGVEVFVFDLSVILVVGCCVSVDKQVVGFEQDINCMFLIDFLNIVWEGLVLLFVCCVVELIIVDVVFCVQVVVDGMFSFGINVILEFDVQGQELFCVVILLKQGECIVGVVVMFSVVGELDGYVC